ncbi:hypothetical protein T439DRAFT_803 [Meredithblackwellia eburnea MCA 4105]
MESFKIRQSNISRSLDAFDDGNNFDISNLSNFFPGISDAPPDHAPVRPRASSRASSLRFPRPDSRSATKQQTFSQFPKHYGSDWYLETVVPVFPVAPDTPLPHVFPSEETNFEGGGNHDEEDPSSVQVAKYSNKSNGLTFYYVNRRGPLYEAFVTILTEQWNDRGVIHALHHMLLDASPNGPAFLKALATKLCATVDICNASNERQTTFQIKCATADSLLQFLPIFLYQIFFPDLSEESFEVNVYAIDKLGREFGTAFNEVAGLEADPSFLAPARVKKILYDPKNANGSIIEGSTKTIPTISLDEIKEVHQKYFSPPGTTITLFAPVKVLPVKSLLGSFNPLCDKFSKEGMVHGAHPSAWIRPFVDSQTRDYPPHIEENKDVIYTVPGIDESVAGVSITWVGPKGYQIFEDVVVQCLWAYLTQSETSPLRVALMGGEDPWCTDIIASDFIGFPSVFMVMLVGVPRHKMEAIGEKVKATLLALRRQGFEEVDFARMLDLQLFKYIDQAEASMVDALLGPILSDCIYNGEYYPGEPNPLQSRLDIVSHYSKAEQLSFDQWEDYFDKYILDNPSITLMAKVSSDLYNNVQQAASNRVQDNFTKYKPAELAKHGAALQAAHLALVRGPGEHDLDPFRVPTVFGNSWIDIDVAGAGGTKRGTGRLQASIDAEGIDAPVKIQYIQTDSNLISITAVLSADAGLSAELRALIPTFIMTFFKLPLVTKRFKQLSAKEVDDTLKNFTTHQTIEDHFFGKFVAEDIVVRLQLEPQCYPQAVNILYDLLWGTHFDLDVLKRSLSNQLQSTAARKQDVEEVLVSAWQTMVYSHVSTTYATSLWSQATNARKLLDRLNENPKQFQNDMEQLRDRVTDGSNLRIEVEGNILALPKAVKTWSKIFQPPTVQFVQNSTPVVQSAQPFNALSALALKPGLKASINVVEGATSTWAFIGGQGVMDDHDVDLAPLTVACEMLNVAIPVFSALCEAGMALGFKFNNDYLTDLSGLVRITIMGTPQLLDALGVVKRVVKDLISGKHPFIPDMLSTAMGSLSLNTVTSLRTAQSTAKLAFINESLLDRPPNFSRDHLYACSVGPILLHHH